jgi:hypothetical protein
MSGAGEGAVHDGQAVSSTKPWDRRGLGQTQAFIARALDGYMTEWRDAEEISVEGRAMSARRREPKGDPMPFLKPIISHMSALLGANGERQHLLPMSHPNTQPH